MGILPEAEERGKAAPSRVSTSSTAGLVCAVFRVLGGRLLRLRPKV